MNWFQAPNQNAQGGLNRRAKSFPHLEQNVAARHEYNVSPLDSRYGCRSRSHLIAPIFFSRARNPPTSEFGLSHSFVIGLLVIGHCLALRGPPPPPPKFCWIKKQYNTPQNSAFAKE